MRPGPLPDVCALRTCEQDAFIWQRQVRHYRVFKCNVGIIMDPTALVGRTHPMQHSSARIVQADAYADCVSSTPGIFIRLQSDI